MVYASTWHKTRQYHYYLNMLWGKMVSYVNCGSGEFRDLRGTCPNIANLTGVVCPQFDDYDIVRITRRYMELYPEHVGFKARLRWIIQCVFGPGCVPMPPEAATQAPYIEQRSRGPVPATPTPGVTPEVPTTVVAPPGATISPPTRPPPEPAPEGVPNWVKYGAVGILAYWLLRGR